MTNNDDAPDGDEGAPDLLNLARCVSSRRAHLDLTQVQVWERGGPSNSTLTAIESARPPAPSRSTLKKLDKALEWEDGSARRCLMGGVPVELEHSHKVTWPPEAIDIALQNHVREQVHKGFSEPDAIAQAAVAFSLRRAQVEGALARRSLAQELVVGGGSQDVDSLLYRRPEGVSDEEWARIKDTSRDYIEWLIEKAARER